MEIKLVNHFKELKFYLKKTPQNKSQKPVIKYTNLKHIIGL